jgi:hypothetical protein
VFVVEGKQFMSIANMSDPNTMTGATVKGGDGEKLGKIDAIYFDNDTDKPEWAAVTSGLFGSHVSLVPLAQGTWNNGTLTVPFDKAALQTAPHHDRTRRSARPTRTSCTAITAWAAACPRPPRAADAPISSTSPASWAATPPGRPPTTR